MLTFVVSTASYKLHALLLTGRFNVENFDDRFSISFFEYRKSLRVKDLKKTKMVLVCGSG